MSQALVVIDLQQGFDEPGWGRRNNPDCEANVGRLIEHWRETGQPIVFVRHDSTEPESPLRPDRPGNQFKDTMSGEPDLLVTKSVHSAFHGAPDLEEWLRAQQIERIALCGVQTNMCVETTTRVGCDLGFDVSLVLDASYTFDLPGVSAEQLTAATAATIAADFGSVVTTDQLIEQTRQLSPAA